LVSRIQNQDESALEQLYRIFHRGVRFYLCRHLGPQELEDKIHDTFLIVVQAIRRGDVRDPDRLMGFVRTVVRRQVAAFIDDIIQSRREIVDLDSGTKIADENWNPEQTAIREQAVTIMEDILDNISARDRDILTRFYLLEQDQEQICTEMGLSETQFRLLKSRAKSRFSQVGRKRLAQRALTRLYVRNSAIA
jgi:RNA polymerase sigma-70 factor (ECF subfamily)